MNTHPSASDGGLEVKFDFQLGHLYTAEGVATNGG